MGSLQSPLEHNAFASANALVGIRSPFTASKVMNAETRTFHAAPVAPSTPTKKWEQVHKTGGGVKVPVISGNYIHVILPGGAKKTAALFRLYSDKHSRIVNGYTKLENNRVSKSGGAYLNPANDFMIMGSVYFPDGVNSWSGDVSNSTTTEYAKKSGNYINFKIVGSGSVVQVDVDSEHNGYGNSVTLSNGAKGGWSKPNQEVEIKIGLIYYSMDGCPTGRFLSGGKCKSKGCKNNKYTEYTSLSVITDNSLCKTCTATAGTGYTVDAECNKVAKAGYTIVGGVAKTVGCKDSNYAEYKANAQVGRQSLCLTCKSGYLMRNGVCKKAGCTDSNASNYDNNAEVDDGSCSCKSGFAKDSTSGKCVVAGCTDAGDTGYNSQAVIHDTASCTGVCKGNMVTQNGRCVDPAKQGCMDADADNYDSTAAQDDGSCTYSCGDENRALTEKGTCGEGCNEGYSLVDGICEEITALPGDPLITPQGTVVPHPIPPSAKSNKVLIIGGVAVVAVLGIMMMGKKAPPAAAEWYGY